MPVSLEFPELNGQSRRAALWLFTRLLSCCGALRNRLFYLLIGTILLELASLDRLRSNTCLAGPARGIANLEAMFCFIVS